MAQYTFNALRIDPKQNPAILDTITWDERSLQSILTECSLDSFTPEHIAAANGSISNRVKAYISSHVGKEKNDWYLCETDDGQNFFLSIGTCDQQPLGIPFFSQKRKDNSCVCAFAATADTINQYVSLLCPEKGPKPLGSIPRLGIGDRHSITLWPGIWKSMAKKGYAANAIQNSVRELHRLEALLKGEPAKENHLYSFGKIIEGHTGSTFEGLWTAGVVSALKQPHHILYGADADHLQVKRGSEGTKRTKQYIDAARFYTFYTIDVSDILAYQALTSFSSADVYQLVEHSIPSVSFRKDVVDYHKKKFSSNSYGLNSIGDEMLARFLCKYWHALEAMEELDAYLKDIKQGQIFDLELSIDETPADFSVFKAITSTEELQFLINEIQRRGIGITHIAPNFGVEKGVDYRAPGGLPELEQRVSQQVQLATDHGIMLDCHSGDDLSRETRRIFGRASQGRIHFKVSPYLQILYAETLEELNPDAFRIWWEDSLAYAKESAKLGSSIAKESLQQLTQDDLKNPSASHLFFREYNFATVGKQDSDGTFLFRSMFYTQNQLFQKCLDEKIEQFLNECADDLWNPEVYNS